MITKLLIALFTQKYTEILKLTPSTLSVKHQQSISSDDSDQDSGIMPLRRRLVVDDYEAEDSDH